MDLHVTINDVQLGEVAKLDIVEDSGIDDASATTRYLVRLVVDRGASIGIHNEIIDNWPRDSINAVGLLRAALNKFDTDVLTYEVDDDDIFDGSGDTASSGDRADQRQAALPSALAGGLEGAVREIQDWFG